MQLSQSLRRLNHAQVIGFEDLLSDMNTLSNAYPPHNIIKVSETEYLIELAVAGYSEDDIELSLDKNRLTVSSPESSDQTIREFLYKGISQKRINKSFVLAENVKVTSADLNNGILTIKLLHVVPEDSTTKIKINKEKKLSLLNE